MHVDQQKLHIIVQKALVEAAEHGNEPAAQVTAAVIAFLANRQPDDEQQVSRW